jgi:thioesterase domain-containing protein
VGHQDGVEISPVVFVFPGIDDVPETWLPFCHVYPSIVLEYFDWRQLILSDFMALVADLVARIRAASGGRPVRLVGYSIGGPLALACACELEGQTPAIASLILLDAAAEAIPEVRSNTDRARSVLHKIGQLDIAPLAASVFSRLLFHDKLWPLMVRLLRVSRRQQSHKMHLSVLDRKIRIRVMQRLFFSWWESILRSGFIYQGPAVLLRAHEHPEGTSADMGWGRLCGDLTVVPVVESHRSILTQEGIERVRDWLDPVLSRSSVASCVPAARG